MAAEDDPADVDPDEFPVDDAPTEAIEAIPEAVDDTPTAAVGQTTPRPEVTGRHDLRLTPAQVDLAVAFADRDAFARGVEHGRKLERADAQADAVTEHRRVREDVIETVRALFTIFEIGHPDWPAAEEWIRRRLTPL